MSMMQGPVKGLARCEPLLEGLNISAESVMQLASPKDC
jgi:hypothetical protein